MKGSPPIIAEWLQKFVFEKELKIILAQTPHNSRAAPTPELNRHMLRYLSGISFRKWAWIIEDCTNGTLPGRSGDDQHQDSISSDLKHTGVDDALGHHS
jgi:hypothetical protein